MIIVRPTFRGFDFLEPHMERHRSRRKVADNSIAPSIVAKLRAISALKLILGYPLTDAAAYGHSKGEECGSFRAMAFTVRHKK
jgi:hypothetical protein